MGESTQWIASESDVVHRYRSAARVYFLRHGGANEADDLAQEAMVIAIEAIRSEQIRDPARIGGFVLGVCRNLARGRARGDARRDRALDAHAAAEYAHYEPPGFEVDSFKLWSCVNGLAARAREVVLQTFVEDTHAEEIAQRHATTVGNIRVIRHRALAALLECLEGGGKS